MPTEPQKTDTIILHPNDDGTYHWMCPNCKREDLGLSAETDLTAYCPNVTCPGCGFQFGVDKRYLNDFTSYICGECLLTQRFDGTCGNCGAKAMRRASTPVPLDRAGGSEPQKDLVVEAREYADGQLLIPTAAELDRMRELLRQLCDEVERLRADNATLNQAMGWLSDAADAAYIEEPENKRIHEIFNIVAQATGITRRLPDEYQRFDESSIEWTQP